MKTLTESIKDNSIITESIKVADGLRIPTMKASDSNLKFWEFGYLVFVAKHTSEGNIITVDWTRDGNDSPYRSANFSKDYFVLVDDFDFDFNKLEKNKSKTLKALKKVLAGVDDVTNLKF